MPDRRTGAVAWTGSAVPSSRGTRSDHRRTQRARPRPAGQSLGNSNVKAPCSRLSHSSRLDRAGGRWFTESNGKGVQASLIDDLGRVQGASRKQADSQRSFQSEPEPAEGGGHGLFPMSSAVCSVLVQSALTKDAAQPASRPSTTLSIMGKASGYGRQRDPSPLAGSYERRTVGAAASANKFHSEENI